MWEQFIELWKETRNKHKNHMDTMETNNEHIDFVNEDRFDEMEELSKSLFGEDCDDELDDFIEKFWGFVNEKYDYRDMLTFDEIQKVFEHIKHIKE